MKRSLAATIAAIKGGGGPQLLLLFGDELQVQEACRAILDLVVPESHRGFNLERFDGRVVGWDRIEASLSTPPFFSGQKVLWIENAPYFVSREQQGQLGEKLFQLWREGRRDEASRLLIDLLILEGWTEAQWERLEPLSAQSLSEILDIDGDEMRREIEAMLVYCRAKKMDLSDRRVSEGQRLAELLERGLPQWDVLLLTAMQVDRRTRLFKQFEEKGAVLDLNLERDRRGKISRASLLEWVNQRLRQSGKTLQPQAREMILMRAADDLRAVQQELDKVLLFVGDRRSVGAEDVAAIFADRGEGWIFDLTQAIADRNPRAALAQLARLVAQGEHPLKLLATIASDARRLLSARQLIESELKSLWKRDMSYQQFQHLVLRQDIPPLTRNPYMDYLYLQRAERFSLGELRSYMDELFEADFRLKSSGNNPRIVLERLILQLGLGPEKAKVNLPQKKGT